MCCVVFALYGLSYPLTPPPSFFFPSPSSSSSLSVSPPPHKKSMEAYTKTSVSTNCGIAEKVRHVIMQWNFHQHADSLSGTQSGVQNLYDLIGNLSKCMHYIYVCT